MGEIDKPLAEISKKLDNIQKLLAIITVKGIETEQAKIEMLDRIGFKPVEIASFLGKSPDNISVQLSIIRKKKQKGAKEAAQPTGEKQTETVLSNDKITEK